MMCVSTWTLDTYQLDIIRKHSEYVISKNHVNFLHSVISAFDWTDWGLSLDKTQHINVEKYKMKYLCQYTKPIFFKYVRPPYSAPEVTKTCKNMH